MPAGLQTRFDAPSWSAKLSEDLKPYLCGASSPPPTFAEFVERTTTLCLDPWQRVLCARLERLKNESGQRILIHAPPQHGKSILVSQRFPAWLIGRQPATRVKLACYNVTHATGFGRIVLQLMQSEEYGALFPDPALRVPKLASAESWSTAGRRALMDAQPSFKALGLLTGFVGQGADTLLIDDPYASPQDAASEIIRAHVWSFWDESARVRLNERSNVVVMFHRYREDDLAGRLWETGEWEMMRFPAIADGDGEWPDPLGREEGEKLSPRFSDDFYAAQQLSGAVWLGQFQGRPTAKEGAFFRVGQLQIADAAPANLRRCRAWDLAATPGAGSYTCGVLMGAAPDGSFWVLDIRRDQWATDERNREILQAAALDGREVPQRLPQDPGQAGVDQVKAMVRMLAGYPVKTARVSGSKEVRADPFSSQVNAGNVKLLRAPWNRAFIEELRQFPLGKDADQVDSASDAFTELAQPGEVIADYEAHQSFWTRNRDPLFDDDEFYRP